MSSFFYDALISAIKQISIPAIPKKDKLVWILDSKGNFLVKSAIKTNQSQPIGDVEVNWKSLWKLKLHERYKVLVWRIDNGILPIKAVVASKLGQGDVCCLFSMIVKNPLIICFSNALSQEQSGLDIARQFIHAISMF